MYFLKRFFYSRELIFCSSIESDKSSTKNGTDNIITVKDEADIKNYNVDSDSLSFIIKQLRRGATLVAKCINGQIVSFLFIALCSNFKISELNTLLTTSSHYIYGANTIYIERRKGYYADLLRYVTDNFTGIIWISCDVNNSNSLSVILKNGLFYERFSCRVTQKLLFRKVSLRLY